MSPALDFEVHEASLHGHRAVYRTAGSGPNVVLIHGMINSSRHWEAVAQRLAGSEPAGGVRSQVDGARPARAPRSPGSRCAATNAPALVPT